MKEILRRTWAEIDLDALARDFAAVRQAANKNAKVCCVIKADAYGHGAVRMAQEFEALGAGLVRRLQPGGGLAAAAGGHLPAHAGAGLHAPRGGRHPGEAPDFPVRVQPGVRPGALPLRGGGRGHGAHPRENRHRHEPPGLLLPGHQPGRGHRCRRWKAACTLPGLYPEGIFTHFAVSDEGQAGDAFTMRQFGCFKEMIESLLREGISFAVRHCANSAAVFDYPLSHLDMVRAGIVIYGLYPSAALRNRPQLTPVLALKSVVSHVKEVKPGATISYGRKFTAARP